MKYIFALFIWIIAISFQLNAQSNDVSKRLVKFQNDTIQYVKKGIILEKEKYIGKPLDSLLKDFPIQPKAQMPLIDGVKPGQYIGCYLFLYDRKEKSVRLAKGLDPLQISIIWDEPIKSSELKEKNLIRITDWSGLAYDYYKGRIIKDIGIVDYKLE